MPMHGMRRNHVPQRHVPVALLVLAGFVAGCSQTPTAPSNPPTPSLWGRVATIAGFPLEDAMVEGFDGQEAKTSALTDRAGRYELKVPSTGAITLRASKEGYSSSEYRVDLPRTVPADFILDFPEQSVVLRGEYRVTLAADAACVQLPAEVRTRTYDASITPLSLDYYEGGLRNGASPVGSFVVLVNGRFATFYANDSETGVHERLGASASLWILFSAGNAPVDEPSFTVPMAGTFGYCADVSPGSGCRVPLVTCSSANHTFTLVRH